MSLKDTAPSVRNQRAWPQWCRSMYCKYAEQANHQGQKAHRQLPRAGGSGQGSACLMGGGFLREEVKCSDLESGDGCTTLQTDDKSLSCTFYRVDFMTCELDSNLKIPVDKGVVF